MAAVKIASSELELLRAMRLYHWRKVMFHRREAQRQEAKGKEKWAEVSHGKANVHIRYVVTLNSFFLEVGDTAEHDNSVFEARYREIGG